MTSIISINHEICFQFKMICIDLKLKRDRSRQLHLYINVISAAGVSSSVTWEPVQTGYLVDIHINGQWVANNVDNIKKWIDLLINGLLSYLRRDAVFNCLARSLGKYMIHLFRYVQIYHTSPLVLHAMKCNFCQNKQQLFLGSMSKK